MTDLNAIQGQLRFLPDMALMQELRNPDGGIPAYLALAELNRRQKIRQDAPKPMPQGTVADDVVNQIRQAGMQTVDALGSPRPPQGIAQAQPLPPPMMPQGIAQAQQQAQPQGMRRGGLIKYADGTGDTTVPAAPHRGILSALSGDVQPIPFNPPDPMTLQQAQQAIGPIWGQGQNYGPLLNEINSLRQQQPQPIDDRARLALQGQLMAASKEASPVVATAQSGLGAWNAQRQAQQQYFNNDLNLIGAQAGIQNQDQQQKEALTKTLINYSQTRDQYNLLKAHDSFEAQLQTQQLQRQMEMMARQFVASSGSIGGAIGLKSIGEQMLKEAQDNKDPQAIKNAQDIISLGTNALQTNYEAEQKKNQFELQKELSVAVGRTNVENAGKLAVAKILSTMNVPDLGKVTQTTYSGIPYIDGSEMHGKVYDYVYKTASDQGIPVVGKEVASTIRDLDTARMNQDYMLNLIQSRLAKDPTGRFYAAADNTLAKLSQTDPALATIGTFRNAAIQTLRSVAGSKGLRINQAEIKLALDNDIPQMTDTLPVAQQRINNLKAFMNNVEASNLQRNRQANAQPNTQSSTPATYKRYAQSGNHVIGSNDGKTWYDTQSGQQVEVQ